MDNTAPHDPTSSRRGRGYAPAALGGFFIGIFALPVLYNLGFRRPLIALLPVALLLFALLFFAAASRLAEKRTWALQAARFLIVGFLNTSISFGLLNFGSLVTGVYSGPGIAALNAAAFIVGFTNSFIWNRYWTFGKSTSSVITELSKFLAVTLGSLALDTGLVFSLTTFVPHDGFSPAVLENLAKIAGAATSMVWNFLGYKFIVFKK